MLPLRHDPRGTSHLAGAAPRADAGGHRNLAPLRCLLVEDSAEFTRIASHVLDRAGFTADVVGNGEQALEFARRNDYDLVLLDVTLPGMDGFDVCRQLRSFTDTYVLMVTGRDDEIDRVVGLRLGADDYITKPYFPAELEARIAAVRRRPRGGSRSPELQVFGRLVLDLAGREARADEHEIPLTRIEFDLLAALASDPGRVLSRAVLLLQVWGHQQGEDRVVDVHVGNLRRKLRTAFGHANHVRTVRGTGYRFGSDLDVAPTHAGEASTWGAPPA